MQLLGFKVMYYVIFQNGKNLILKYYNFRCKKLIFSVKLEVYFILMEIVQKLILKVLIFFNR